MRTSEMIEWRSYNTKIIDGLHRVIDYLNEEAPEETDKIATYREMLKAIYEMEDKEANQ